jgi:hypothetical protein
VLMIAQPRRGRCEPGDLSDRKLAGRVYRQARCAGLRVDPDEWFPIAEKVDKHGTRLLTPSPAPGER